MQQQRQPRDRDRGQPPSALPDPLAGGQQTALVSHGIHAEVLPIAGMTVGEVRRRLGDRFDLDPGSEAFVDGNRVGDDRTILAGEALLFGHRLGEKGSEPDASLEIVGDQVVVRSPEGRELKMPVAEFLPAATPRWFASTILPEGVRTCFEWDLGAILVHQTPTRVHNCKWIATGSRLRHGPGTQYRNVRIAMPYVIVIAVFVVRRGRLTLADWNECFFRNGPVRSIDDELCYPALLNCSRFENPGQRPLSWICTQNLDRREIDSEPDPSKRVSRSMQALVTHLLDTGFNWSSEEHELSSWFSETVSANVDPRIASVEAWQDATAEDPFFVEQVEWLPTGLSVRQVAERICEIRGLRSESDGQRLLRIVVNSALAPEHEQEQLGLLETPF